MIIAFTRIPHNPSLGLVKERMSTDRRSLEWKVRDWKSRAIVNMSKRPGKEGDREVNRSNARILTECSGQSPEVHVRIILN